MKHAHLMRAFFDSPLALMPEKIAAISELIRHRVEIGKLTAEEIEARTAATKPSGSRAGAVAVLPLFGVISQRMNMMSAMSGGTSTEGFTANFRQAMADPGVKSILIQIDSPGGGVFGVGELADEIRAARDEKRIVAVADSLAASAAYWIGSQASEFVATPGAQVGSIGVYAEHVDYSAADAAMGIKTTLISAGRYKTDGHESQPLSDTAAAAIQEQVNGYYDQFTAAVARGRGVDARRVRAGFGEGRVLSAAKAKAEGMIDRIATFDQTLNRMLGSGGDGARSDEDVAIIAEEPAAPVLAPRWRDWDHAAESDVRVSA